MNRRTFVQILTMACAAAVPVSEQTTELEKQMKKRFGDDFDDVMLIVREAIRDAAFEHPEIDPSIEYGLEKMTDLAFDKCLQRLKDRGLWESNTNYQES